MEPRLTPAFGVAGVLLIFAGVGYLIIGIKNAWLQTFFSVNLLGNLGTTVLILYVTAVPVSDGVQGAYLVGVTLTGVIMGVGSTFFKEITEGLACMLGGFALSMWIVTLVPGGLIPQEAPKAAFISVLSVGSFGFFFSHHTRDLALIGLISFGGATTTVIGIDCFTRAGLKEFWAYIWDLNEDLFPIGTKTYPITKGMRVECAAIILLFLVGIISQMKLWRVIQDRRAKRAAEKAEQMRSLQAEEEAVGREVEETTARERRAWERVHGSGESTMPNSQTSDNGEFTEKAPIGTAISTRPQSSTNSGVNDESVRARPDAPLSPEPALMASGEGEGGQVMVRVVPDRFPRAPDRGVTLDPDEQEWASASHEAQPTEQLGILRSMTTSPPPEVIPLPFQPIGNGDGDNEVDRWTAEARSSIVGTYAEEDERPQSMRSSLAKRFSQGSANLLRSLSQRMDKNLAQDGGESREQLVEKRPATRTDDDRGSLAATADVASLDDGRSTIREDDRKSIEITADLSEDKAEGATETAEQHAQSNNHPPTSTVNEGVESVARSEVPSLPKGSSAGVAEAPVAGSSASKRDNSSSAASSTHVPLTSAALPEPLSKTALKYRTNEWVKHSTIADAPDPDDIYIYDAPEPEESEAEEEPAAPVNVDELQQTATTGTPAPAPSPPRASTSMSNLHARSISRVDSRMSLNGRHDPPSRANGRSTPGTLPVDPIPEEPGHAPRITPAPSITPAPEDDRSSSRTSTSPTPFRRSRAVSVSPQHSIPYSSTHTLMGQRETYIRNKPLGTQTPLNTGTPVDYSLSYNPTPSESPVDYGTPAHSRSRSPDDDDMPLSQRRALIRQSSNMSFSRAPSTLGTPDTGFNSHQPQRNSSLPHPAVRQVQLANFRQSVQADLRSGTPVMPSTGRESVMDRGLEVQRGIEIQRNALLREKEAEAQAREAERWEKERRERAFEAMARSGELMGAHREAMRRLQNQARDS